MKLGGNYDDLFREAERIHSRIRRPREKKVSDACDLQVSSDGKYAAFSGFIAEELNGNIASRICLLELESKQLKVLTTGPGSAKNPRFSPIGFHVAFVSDRDSAGAFQIELLEIASGKLRALPEVPGWVDDFQWSSSGRRICMVVAGKGADVAGIQGAIPSTTSDPSKPAWFPKVVVGADENRWRRLWSYDLGDGAAKLLSVGDVNVWEAAWAGRNSIVAIVSDGPTEGDWYGARVEMVDAVTQETATLYHPQDQIGVLRVNADGSWIAFIEAVSSDRGSVAGQLVLIECRTRRVVKPSLTFDVSSVEWIGQGQAIVAGHSGFDTLVGVLDVVSGVFQEKWRSRLLSGSGKYISAIPVGDTGRFALIAEGFNCAPEIGEVTAGNYRRLMSFDQFPELTASIPEGIPISWHARDGKEIQGWLLRSTVDGPQPVVVSIHGGPVSHWRPMWLGRRNVHLVMLLQHGYSIFLPNPRGSNGRGVEFARCVVGDMGGADTFDHITGIEFLEKEQLIDPLRIGLTGVSYGGFMTSWLITQDNRFAAAVPIAPCINWVTEHLISNIPQWVSLFLQDELTNIGGKYYSRSPLMYARDVRTPTLNVCGNLDRCTPPTEAEQFHSALMEQAIPSVLVCYPLEGHGIRKFPAMFDFAARFCEWFLRYMPSNSSADKTP